MKTVLLSSSGKFKKHISLLRGGGLTKKSDKVWQKGKEFETNCDATPYQIPNYIVFKLILTMFKEVPKGYDFAISVPTISEYPLDICQNKKFRVRKYSYFRNPPKYIQFFRIPLTK